MCEKCNCEKTWTGSDIICPFEKGEKFTSDNWNCGIIGEIRLLCDIDINNKDSRIYARFCDDQWYATIDISKVDIRGLCLFVSWYKNRGRTEAMWILDENNVPRVPTFSELEKIIKFYNQS